MRSDIASTAATAQQAPQLQKATKSTLQQIVQPTFPDHESLEWLNNSATDYEHRNFQANPPVYDDE